MTNPTGSFALPIDGRSGGSIQNGVGDSIFQIIRAQATVTETSVTSQGWLDVHECSLIFLALNYNLGNAETDLELQWTWSDKSKALEFAGDVPIRTVNSGNIIPMNTIITLLATAQTCYPIPNPGAYFMNIYINGNATPGTSSLGIFCLRSCANIALPVILPA